VDKDVEPAASAGAAPLEQVKQSVHSDLQYVSIQVDGTTYGGWYRLLPDGQMELLALANMHCERRFENTPVEQARGMLADFIRVARPKSKTNGSLAADSSSARTGEDRSDGASGTLGELLYANKSKTRVSEKNWLGLVQSIAAGDQHALRELYERTHRVVFTLILRLTDNRTTAEALTLDVFRDVWRRASSYDAASGTVVAWIMNQARSRAIDHLMFASEHKRGANGSDKVVGLSERNHTDVLSPSEALWDRLALRIAAEAGGEPLAHATTEWEEPEWEDVAPGISCKLLATDTDDHRVSMLVRLAPGVDYPPHRHAGVEELHLLQGQLLINERTLSPGDYSRSEPGTADKRVWSETGCMCVLITSSRDALG
jgi:anti-sigma factor ChrR (cupin superfamily)